MSDDADEKLADLRRRIERSVVASSGAGREVIEVGAFTALIDPSTPLKYLNYAVPTRSHDRQDGGDGLRRDLVQLESLFAARERVLRFEFTSELWPALAPALADFGLAHEGLHPMMMVRPGGIVPMFGRGVQVRYLAPDEPEAVLREYHVVRNSAYDLRETPSAAEVGKLRESLTRGSLRAGVATMQGRMVGIAALLAAQGIAELAGVGTLPAARRRGVAGCLSARLSSDFLEAGGEIVWLSAGDPVAQAVYSRIGFQPFATHTAWSRS